MTRSRSGVRSLLLLSLSVAATACASLPKRVAVEDGAAGLPPISPNRPTFSDSPGLIPVGHVQLETGYTFARHDEGGVETTSHAAPEALVRYRVSDTAEAWLLWGGYVWSGEESDAGREQLEGGSDVGIALMVPLAEQSGWLPATTLQARTTVGVGSEDVSSGRADPTLKLLWGYSGGVLPDWLGIGGNLIVSYPSEDGDRFLQPAASIFSTVAAPDGETSYFVEWFVVGRPANNVDATQSANAGVVHRLNPRTAIDARVGFGLDSRADDVFGGVGISFLF